MNQPSPAIVAQAAVRRLPRLALLLFCVAYVLPGFIGRDAWKSADVTALGFFSELARGSASFWSPTLVGQPPENPALLPYWLGAWAIQWSAGWIPADFAVRIPFGLLLVLALVCVWYGTYYLARSPAAQPVAFAFGGEANPKDYARTIADGALLALIACLGLAQLAHETTPALTQLGFSSLLLFAFSALPYHRRTALFSAWLGAIGLGLSGAPTLATLIFASGMLVHAVDQRHWEDGRDAHPWRTLALLLGGLLVAVVLFTQLGLWQWKIEWPSATWLEFRAYSELLLWFTWPTWPLALWTLWQWRRQILHRHLSRHLAWPLWILLVILTATLTSRAPDRTLLQALPALAALAAFALPTLRRQVAAIIDWFTLLFFSTCGFIIWTVWIAMLTGVPAQPAANVRRLAPGFEPEFSLFAFALAVLATSAWAWLVRWRVGRHRAAIWKSLVLPAGGAALCWMLLMTLWMPLLNFAQSYAALARTTRDQMQPAGCVEVVNLGQAKLAALQHYGDVQTVAYPSHIQCPWLVSEPDAVDGGGTPVDATQWIPLATLAHPTDGNERIQVYRRR